MDSAAKAVISQLQSDFVTRSLRDRPKDGRPPSSGR
jgi:hypothetical protein